MIETNLILVDEQDQQIGLMEKMEAHQKGLLHRAFSVFIFNERQEMLLQQRAEKKYHSGGLWTNACCSHPLPGETVIAAGQRRLHEEMGFSAALEAAFSFIYRCEFDNGLTEHEFDHVLIGYSNGPVHPDPKEVQDYCYQTLDEIAANLQTHPHRYTAWFRIAFPKLQDWLQDRIQNPKVA